MTSPSRKQKIRFRFDGNPLRRVQAQAPAPPDEEMDRVDEELDELADDDYIPVSTLEYLSSHLLTLPLSPLMRPLERLPLLGRWLSLPLSRGSGRVL